MRDLSGAVCDLLNVLNASHEEGVSAVMTLLVAAQMDEGQSKQRTLEEVGKCWDFYETLQKAFQVTGTLQ
jgi:hypothetical protein